MEAVMDNSKGFDLLKERPLTAAFEAMKARVPVPVPVRSNVNTEELRRQAANGGFQGFGSPPGKF
jgi:hypothetical protein